MLEHHVSAKITRKRLYAGPAATTLTTSRIDYVPEGIRSEQFFGCFSPSQRGPIGSPRPEELLETLPKACRSV
jgi:hypothetical protein